jgi:effector-binding domain-containing protein
MEYQVHVEQVQSQPTAVIRCRARLDELSRVVPQCCGEVWNYARSAGLPRPGRHVAIYYDCEINLEVGAEMAQPFTGDGRVVCSSTPAGMVATAAHWGPYHRLGEAHGAILKWCGENGYALTGVNWEVYGHCHSDDPAKLRTDVYYQLRPAADPAG